MLFTPKLANQRARKALFTSLIYTNDYNDKINDDNNEKRRSIKQQCSQIKFFKKRDLLHDPTSNNVTSIPTNVI